MVNTWVAVKQSNPYVSSTISDKTLGGDGVIVIINFIQARVSISLSAKDNTRGPSEACRIKHIGEVLRP